MDKQPNDVEVEVGSVKTKFTGGAEKVGMWAAGILICAIAAAIIVSTLSGCAITNNYGTVVVSQGSKQ